MCYIKSCGRKYGIILDYFFVKWFVGWVFGLVYKVLGLIVSVVLGYCLV